jgi:MFS family permease
VIGVGIQTYRDVLSIRDVRRVLVLSFVMRIPLWAGNVVMTLHVVTRLDRSYAAAGLLVGVATLAASVSAPWRGRLLDRVGLRRAILPSLVVLAACWSVAPFVGYWPLVILAALANLFLVPSFSIIRQALMHAVDDSRRRTVLSLDSVTVEISYMVGPAAGVLLATYWPTYWALFACEFATIAGGLLLWVANPPLRAEASGDAGDQTRVPARTWMSAQVVAVLAMSVAATIVLTGTDVGVVAALRDLGHQPWIGWELTLWGCGSAVGGLIYGALHRSIPVALLLGLLAATTVPIALAPNAGVIAALLFVAGLFCAPTITAAVDALSTSVPERARGEALGWHGSAMTPGGALGAPIAGIAIDAAGWPGGFVTCGCVGLAVAAAGMLALRTAPSAHPPGRTAVADARGAAPSADEMVTLRR